MFNRLWCVFYRNIWSCNPISVYSDYSINKLFYIKFRQWQHFFKVTKRSCSGLIQKKAAVNWDTTCSFSTFNWNHYLSLTLTEVFCPNTCNSQGYWAGFISQRCRWSFGQSAMRWVILPGMDYWSSHYGLSKFKILTFKYSTSIRRITVMILNVTK